MRKIEQLMVAAIKNKKDFHLDNTTVIIDTVNDKANVFLHNNHIGEYVYGQDCFMVNKSTLEQWPSNTTKSRLRALGCNVYTKKGVTYLNDEPIN